MLRKDNNKSELLRFLSEDLIKWFDNEDRQLVITDGEAALRKLALPDLASLALCSHEDVDSRCFRQPIQPSIGHHNIMIRSVDTGVVVLTVSVAHGFQTEDELWLAFRSGKCFQ